jgi:TPR repeat protein
LSGLARTFGRVARLTALCLGAALLGSGPSAAESSGDVEQLVDLAIRHEHAEGVPKDLARAATLYCEASRRGSARGAYQLGWMRLYGRGVERDDGKAVFWLQRAAERNHAHAPKLLEKVKAEAQPDDQLCPAAPSEIGKLAVPAYIRKIVDRLAPEHQLDPVLVVAIMAIESGFQPKALSHKGAQGLMQLIPETAARFRVADVWDPEQNIRGGMQYLRFLLQLFDGDVTLAAAAYNAGERAVMRHAGVPPYPETQRYVEALRRHYDKPTLKVRVELASAEGKPGR